ncbi:MAG: hypothetical protein KJ852_09310 [Gammaproteobacteria bacterium]|nr:hypothetical protein [Gammaproteobacteria bacterium]MBU0787905.1 hypothetical protein [Gammaproteobacteria bacterium]MBU0816978.1 hypothetical protein [Gammaproteobacteria bacterium]MBU1787142.1 hypothetical protein [Gammaproteobacteria bacterium]
MHAQLIVVVMLVAGSFAYAAWTLMPQAWQRALRASAGKTPLRRILSDRWLTHEETTGCGSCGCCAASSATPDDSQASAEKPLHFVQGAGRR